MGDLHLEVNNLFTVTEGLDKNLPLKIISRVHFDAEFVASSPPIPSHTWSSESFPSTSQLSSPRLPFRDIQQTPEHPGIRGINSNNHPIRAISPLDPSDALPAEFLAALKDDIEEFESGSGDEYIKERRKRGAEAAANQAFLDEDLESDFASDDESAKDFEANKSDVDSSTSSKDSEASVHLQNDQAQARVGLVATCSTNYAREKLVRILNGEAVVPNQ